MRRWRRLAWLLVLLVVIPGIRVVWNRHDDRTAGEQKLVAVEMALDQSDPGWRLDDLLAKRDAAVPPDDRNLTKLCWDIYEARPPGFERWTADRGDWLPVPYEEFNRLPAADALAAARVAADEAADAVRLTRSVRDRPTGGWKLEVPANPLDTKLEHVQRVRTVAALAELDAVLAGVDGDPGRAAAAVADGLHVCKAVGDEPFLISQLVRMAVSAIAASSAQRLLAWGEPQADRLADLRTTFRAEAEFPRLTISYRGERAFFHRLFANLDAGRFTLAQLGGVKAGPLDRFGAWVYAGHLPGDQAFSLEFQTRLLAITAEPTHRQIDLFAAVVLPPKEQRTLLSRVLLPAFDKVAAADWRTRGRLRATAAALGCERFRQQHGRWPDALADLGDPIPLDPYTGQPLRFKRQPDGLVIYAVGPDRTDDDGTLGSGRGDPGEDIGFRLWDVAARRRPAPED